MLILSRWPGERATILTPSGEVIEVIIADVRGLKVRLGFEAKPDIKIHRNEVLERDRRERNEEQQP